MMGLPNIYLAAAFAKTTQKPKKTKKPSSKRPLAFKDLIDPEEGSDD